VFVFGILAFGKGSTERSAVGERLHSLDEGGLVFLSNFGGGVVGVATGTPTSMKNFSCPKGEQIQSMRTGLAEVL